jgi:hypothetical protein
LAQQLVSISFLGSEVDTNKFYWLVDLVISRFSKFQFVDGGLEQRIRSGSLTVVARELARYKLYFVGVQEVRWVEGGTVRAGEYIFFYGKGKENHQL